MWLCFTALTIRVGDLCVVEGWHDRERLLVKAICRATQSSNSAVFVVAHDRDVRSPTVHGELRPVRVMFEIKFLPVIWHWVLWEGELER